MDALASVGMALVGLCALVVTVLLMRAMPRATFALWCAVLFFVPVWVGVSAGPFWAAITIVTLLAIAAGGANLQLSPVDGFVLAFALLLVGQFGLRATSLSEMVIGLVEWIVPYAWGRLVLARVEGSFITRCIAFSATVAAVLAIIEFGTGVNVFLLIPVHGPSFETWGPLQGRGGLIRAEGAFGHSIALGASLAMASAFVIATAWPTWIRISALAAITGAIVLTLSRIGLVSLVLAVALSVMTLPGIGKRTRVLVTLTGVIGAVIALPFLDAVFGDAGQEAQGAAAYRGGLFGLLPIIQLFGGAQSIAGVTRGGEYIGFFADSIDNALLVVALRVGWIPTLMLVAALVIAMAPIVRPGRASPALVAIVSQVPSLLTVAFITQYGMFFWFLVGLAVSWEVARRSMRIGGIAEPAAGGFTLQEKPMPRTRELR